MATAEQRLARKLAGTFGARLSGLIDVLRKAGLDVTPEQELSANRVMLGLLEKDDVPFPLSRLKGRLAAVLLTSPDGRKSFETAFQHAFGETLGKPPTEEPGTPVKEIPGWRALRRLKERLKPPVLLFVLAVLIFGAVIGYKIFFFKIIDPPCVSGQPGCAVIVIPKSGDVTDPKTDTGPTLPEMDDVEKERVANAARRLARALPADRTLTLVDLAKRLYPTKDRTSDRTRWVRFLRKATADLNMPHDKPVLIDVLPPVSGEVASTETSFVFSQAFSAVVASMHSFENPRHETGTAEVSTILAEAVFPPDLLGTGNAAQTETSALSRAEPLALVGGLLVFLPLVLAAYWLSRQRSRLKDYLRRRMPEVEPIMTEVAVSAGHYRDGLERSLRLASGEMARHREIPTGRIDIPGSIEATLRNGGWFSARHQETKVRPSYLLVIAREGSGDQDASRMDDLFKGLHEGDATAERYFMDADANIFYKDDDDDGLTLGALYDRFPDHNLVYIGSGDAFLRPGARAVWPWSFGVRLWSHRAYLTPVDRKDMDRREVTLAELLDASPQPATLEGLAAAVRIMNSDEETILERYSSSGRPLSWEIRPDRWLLSHDVDDEDWHELLRDLRYHFGAQDRTALHWLASCAIYPEMNWAIALFLGLRLKDRSGNPYHTEERAMRLTGLPWFRRGWMPDPVRQRLLDLFRTEAPEEHKRAVLEIVELLNRRTISADPGDRHAITLRIGQEPASAPKGMKTRRKLKQDAVLLESLVDAEVTELVVPVDRTWRQKLGDFTAIHRLRELGKLSLFILFSLVLAVLYPWPGEDPAATNPWMPLFLLATGTAIAGLIIVFFFIRDAVIGGMRQPVRVGGVAK